MRIFWNTWTTPPRNQNRNLWETAPLDPRAHPNMVGRLTLRMSAVRRFRWMWMLRILKRLLRMRKKRLKHRNKLSMLWPGVMSREWVLSLWWDFREQASLLINLVTSQVLESLLEISSASSCRNWDSRRMKHRTWRDISWSLNDLERWTMILMLLVLRASLSIESLRSTLTRERPSPTDCSPVQMRRDSRMKLERCCRDVERHLKKQFS